MKRFYWIATLAICVAFGSTAVAQTSAAPKSDSHAHEHSEMELPTFGVAVVRPTKDSKVSGMLRLTQKGEELRIMGKINNLSPGEHGFHVHSFGDLRGTDGTATGGHYDAHGHKHGAPGAESHAGDLGNITADENGVATVDISTTHTKLHFILGRAFVVHAGKDDLTSQPSGDAGGRVATGVIGIGNPDFKMGAKK